MDQCNTSGALCYFYPTNEIQCVTIGVFANSGDVKNRNIWIHNDIVFANHACF